MPDSRLAVHRALAVGAVALVSAMAGCSRGELSAAERDHAAMGTSAADSVTSAGGQASITADSSPLTDPLAAQRQTLSVEDVVKASPLRNLKADCATPVSSTVKPAEIGGQCSTDPPSKN
jgi:hypothetical protein